jgi:hypothetical protein
MTRVSDNLKTDAGDQRAREPRWPAALAMLALGGLYAGLPPSLLPVGPRWMVPSLMFVLLVPAIVTHRRGRHRVNQLLGYALNGVVTLAMIVSLWLLIRALPSHTESSGQLLLSAAGLWVCNILVFASWYWRLDAGGPHQRALTTGHTDGAFLFPQMAMDPQVKIATGEQAWAPHFVDYLFLAFNTSTAFSPTDTAPLSRWAKVLMMTQSTISLLVIAVLAGRAVNIL